MTVEENIIAYFEGALSEAEREELLIKVKARPEDQRLFNEYKSLYEGFENETLVVPSEAFAARVKSQLLNPVEEHHKKNRIRSFQVVKYAAAILLLVSMGILIGLNFSKSNQLADLSEELLAVKTEMKTLLQNKSTAQRIRAVKMSNEFEVADPEVLSTLILTMNTDDSENVRIAAIDALESFSYETQVKKAFIEALKNSEDDLIKIKLIRILADQKNKKLLPLVEEIIQDKAVSKYLRSEATKGRTAVINI